MSQLLGFPPSTSPHLTFAQTQELSNDVKARGKKQIYILKPDAGCQGKGIRLMQGGKEETLQKTLKEMDTLNVVAQHYLPKPFLIHGYKFDMRIYSLVSEQGKQVMSNMSEQGNKVLGSAVCPSPFSSMATSLTCASTHW